MVRGQCWRSSLASRQGTLNSPQSTPTVALTRTSLVIKPEQGAREGATLWLVPVSISYERVPEQARLAEELLAAREREGCQGGGGKRRPQQQQPMGAVGLTGLLR